MKPTRKGLPMVTVECRGRVKIKIEGRGVLLIGWRDARDTVNLMRALVSLMGMGPSEAASTAMYITSTVKRVCK